MTSSPRKRRPFRWIFGGLLFVGLGLYLARDPIATTVAGRLLARNGTTCEELAVHVGRGLQSASIAPTTCVRAEGRVSELAFPAGASVELAGFRLQRVHAEELRVALREAPESLEGLGLALVDEQVSRVLLLRAVGELARFGGRDDRVDLAFDRVELGREGRALVATGVVARRTDEGMHVAASEVGPRSGVARRGGVDVTWRVRELEARATRAEVDARATVVVDASLVGLAFLEPRSSDPSSREPRPANEPSLRREEEARVEIRGRGLDGEAPEVDLEVTTSPAVRALRERASELRDRWIERRAQ